jgi:hypothetical protein
MSPLQQAFEWAMGFLKGQPARVASYCISCFVAGNWVGVTYAKQSATFWGLPIVALMVVVVTVLATLRSNDRIKTEMVVKQFTEPDRPPTDKEAAILARAGIEVVPK